MAQSQLGTAARHREFTVRVQEDSRTEPRDARHRLGHAIATGVIAGLAGSWAMGQFASTWDRLSGLRKAKRGFAGSPHERDASLHLATRIGAFVLHRRLSRQEREAGAAIVHYGNAAVLGAIYAVAAEFAPAVTWGRGIGFGSFFWYFGLNLAVPALGLGGDYPLGARLESLGEHIVYGVVTDAVRGAVRDKT